MFDAHMVCRAFSRAWAKTGKRIAARMAMMAITTSSSMRVKPRCFRCRIVSAFSLRSPGDLLPLILDSPVLPEECLHPLHVAVIEQVVVAPVVAGRNDHDEALRAEV